MKTSNSRNQFFTHQSAKYRVFYAVLLLISVLAISAAWYLQNVENLAPCPLCIMQRFGFFALGLMAFWGLLLGSVGCLGNAVAVVLGVVALAIAGYHNWILAHPSVECGIDPVQNFVNDLATAQWWPEMFMSTGSCTAELPLFFGLSIPQWSLLCLGILTLGFAWRWLKN